MSRRRSSGQGQSSLGYLFGGDSNELGQPKVSSPPVFHSGGGQSSLGYLFGSGELGQTSSLKNSPPVCVPPYGTDENSSEKPNNASPKSYVYHKVDSQDSRNFLMSARPSTRVTSVPGGDSSVGYLFGDK
ncbi:hypothetical protein OSB04_009922 [Centaurea solstitialis]|uniref:Protein SPIRAL1-like 5 n=1 Tax=Centaurea solstitialis TaxID=347529 RepID=A0AA38TRD9_9ASTR|nr:hypothetical protein OSB04_009922 [Centaurea solstitialis]